MKRIFNKIFSFLLVFVVAFGLPVAASQSSAASTAVKVTVEILQNSVSTKVNSATYYVTAYSDSACTKVVTTKSVTLNNASSGTVTFDNLSAGTTSTTYYFAESNSSGTLKTDTSTLTISYPYGNIAYVTANDSTTKELKIQNNYSSDPNTASARTADENQPLLFGGIAVLCVLVGGAVILMRRKHV